MGGLDTMSDFQDTNCECCSSDCNCSSCNCGDL